MDQHQRGGRRMGFVLVDPETLGPARELFDHYPPQGILANATYGAHGYSQPRERHSRVSPRTAHVQIDRLYRLQTPALRHSDHRMGRDVNYNCACHRDHVPPSHGRSSTKKIPLHLAPTAVTVPEDLAAVHGLLGGSSPPIEDLGLLQKQRYGYLETVPIRRACTTNGGEVRR